MLNDDDHGKSFFAAEFVERGTLFSVLADHSTPLSFRLKLELCVGRT